MRRAAAVAVGLVYIIGGLVLAVGLSLYLLGLYRNVMLPMH